jgi:hypothetical protein
MTARSKVDHERLLVADPGLMPRAMVKLAKASVVLKRISKLARARRKRGAR